MKDYNKLHQAMDEVCDQYLKEAGATRRKKRFPWLGAVAASLAAALLLAVLNPLVLLPPLFGTDGSTADPQSPGGHTTGEVQSPPTWSTNWLSNGVLAVPEYPEMAPYPQDPNADYDTLAYSQWKTGLKNQYSQPDGYEAGLNDFFARSIPLFLGNSDKNAVCSPLNIYMALSMLAETTGGNSRSSILSVLNAQSIESLRTQAGHVWNAHYRSDGATDCLLANSLWLNEGYTYNRDTVNTLADSYYASVYQGDLGSDTMNNALRAWLSQQTRGLLDPYIQDVKLSPEVALALASTVYFQAKWANPFWSGCNTVGEFHSPAGDVEATYMNDTLYYGPYYYGEDYGAVQLGLDPAGVNGGASMWLVLPDEGYDPQDLLESGHAMGMILGSQQKDAARVKVHLSLPKFDISAETDLRESLSALGLGGLFDPQRADFSAILPEASGARLEKVSHAARVAIDEEGVTAAAYTVMQTYGAPIPPEEEVYFTLDRPFLFVITSADGLPLFAGVVNEP